MHSLREFFLDDLATCRASLRRVAWINSYCQPASVFSFVGGVTHELIPCSVTDAFCKAVVSHHVCDRQILKRDEVVFVNQLSTKLVGKVGSSISNAFVDARDNLACLASSKTALRLCGKFALGFSERILILAKETRVVDLLAGAKSGKGSQPNVHTDLLACVWQDVLFCFAHDQDKPLFCSVGKGHCLNLAFRWAMKLCLDVANKLKVARETFDLAPITIRRIFNRLELSKALESWEPRLLTCFDAAKERLVALIESSQCRLKAGIVGACNIFVSRSCALEPSGLLDIPNALLCRFVDKLTLIQSGVVYGPMRFNYCFHSSNLRVSGVKAKLEGTNHGLALWFDALPFSDENAMKHGDNCFAGFSADAPNKLVCVLPNAKVLKIHVIILLRSFALVNSKVNQFISSRAATAVLNSPAT